ncbi:hypothetical protein FRX31_017323 [Thalictrum thalictroides]|uniref:Reverse transcriptase zinc-binding domain-containing protein n=1 Tax=Thalictrum thalictroides TaxID=46969 RepID=A0A7J6W923_THATH|nr:hypothetical protein FRX31_017323 [Thalictrum thalictroides]
MDVTLGNGNGVRIRFSPSSPCMVGQGGHHPPLHPFPYKVVWKANVTLNVRFFIWSLMWGRILTKDKLFGRGVIDNPTCVLCNTAAETVCHLFVSCPTVQLVWETLIGHLDRANSVMQPADPRGILSAWPCINT